MQLRSGTTIEPLPRPDETSNPVEMPFAETDSANDERRSQPVMIPEDEENQSFHSNNDTEFVAAAGVNQNSNDNVVHESN